MTTTVAVSQMISSADIIFVVSGLIGMVTHYFKKILKSETDVSIHQWFGKSNIAATVTSIGTFFAAVVGALGSGIITADMNIYAIMYAGFATGFAIDSGFNSDETTATLKKTKTDIKDLNS